MNYFNYYTEIEDTFVRRRGKHLFLSPLDWALMEAWQDRGIPLHIVLRSIESVFDVFDKQPPGTRTIKSLFYCREEIEVQYKEWMTSQAGKSEETEAKEETGGFSLEAIRGHIETAIEKLGRVAVGEMDEDITRAIERLNQLNADLATNFESIDGSLGDVEKLLERAMLTNWDRGHLKVLEKEIASQLRAYKADMDADSYKNTFDLMLLKRLREEAGIPRLGLYFL
ncbi:MAG: hypothetical protein KBF83_11970 [Pyrinomonadaceae bacterium]|nr:hypothetical protein [Acidobacteriota bacterium]MBP9110263.1 hypothetical protein [Pyrinomonadaceae bacterium]